MPTPFNYNRDAFKQYVASKWSDIYAEYPASFDVWDLWVTQGQFFNTALYQVQSRQLLSGVDSAAMSAALEAALGTVEQILTESDQNAMADAVEENTELAPPEN